MQIEIEAGELEVSFDNLADPARVEDQRGFARQAGAALAPQFAPEVAALQPMTTSAPCSRNCRSICSNSLF